MSATAAMMIVAQTVIYVPTVEVKRRAVEGDDTWQIAPSIMEMVDEDKELRGKTTVLRQRLVPKVLVTVASDVERADGGDRWAKAGDQLFGTVVDGMDAYCVLESKLNVTVKMFLVPTRDVLKQDCFVDSDGDGLLDRRFEADPGIGVLPNVGKIRSSTWKDLTPVAFEATDPQDHTQENWVELRYRTGGKKAGKPAQFEIRYRYDGKTQNLSERIIATEEDGTQIIAALGAQIAVEKDENGKLKAKVREPMSSDFGVEGYFARR